MKVKTIILAASFAVTAPANAATNVIAEFYTDSNGVVDFRQGIPFDVGRFVYLMFYDRAENKIEAISSDVSASATYRLDYYLHYPEPSSYNVTDIQVGAKKTKIDNGFSFNIESFGFSRKTPCNPGFCEVGRTFEFWNLVQGRVAFDRSAIVRVQRGVPEPATWAMMIGGFGLIGAAARRRDIQFAPTVARVTT